MATAVQVVLPTRSPGILALWHLLSLDAPTVAAVWVWFIARSEGIHLAATVPAAMALTVWILYAADRLLDTRELTGARACTSNELEARHFFHHRHRRVFAWMIAASAFGLAMLLPLLDPAAILLYLVEGGLLVAWFAILHAAGRGHRMPKEFAVGIFFSAAVFIPAVARHPELRMPLLPDAVLLAALCSLNCLFIYAWEHEGAERKTQLPHFTTRLALRQLLPLAASVLIASIAIASLPLAGNRRIASACALSVILLLLLHRHRHRFARERLRAAADLALLTPLLMLPLL